MKLGVSLPTIYRGQQLIGKKLIEFAQRAEQAGFASLWAGDHFLLKMPPMMASRPPLRESQNHPVNLNTGYTVPPVITFLEAWTALGFVAGHTQRIKLGSLVTDVSMRLPALLVKTIDTVDALSHGRAYFSVGAGWSEDEHQRLGVPLPSAGQRVDLLEETIQLALQMWKGEAKPFRGKYLQVSDTANLPAIVQYPHPPILIGGSGNRMLRLMARYADACNVGSREKPGDLDFLRERLEKLQAYCQELNRPYAQLTKTTTMMAILSRDGQPGTLSPAAMIDRLRMLAEVGFDEVFLMSMNASEPGIIDLFASEVLPAVEKIVPAGR